MGAFRTIEHSVDFCVIGGGLSGLCAAIAAARHGSRVVLMHDRPMLGGNASSEIRMWVCGAHGRNNQETGIIEELRLENQYRNPDKNYSVWDTILWEKVRFEPNITLLLNCTCQDAHMDGSMIQSVTGWQMTTQTYHRVTAKLFADCSGDSILAPLTGAEFRVGREARAEFGESIAPVEADKRTMGMSCMIQVREENHPSVFTPPAWAEKMTKAGLPHREPNLSNTGENFWYMELGGDRNSIADTETVRDELYGVAMGIWDYLKNDPAQREKNANWRLDWMGMLPGKRESRRYVGDYIMTQHDVEEQGKFDDLIAYGGWKMDDHHPSGFRTGEKPTIFHPAPSPYGIAYRCLYSKDVGNLFCAGRNISATHSALSSTRVMATCALLGQAAGTAAAIAVREECGPRGVYENHLKELRATLMDDDSWLPFSRREVSPLTAASSYESDVPGTDALRSGYDRPIGDDDNGWRAPVGSSVTVSFGRTARLDSVRVVFDSDLNHDTLPEAAARLGRPMIHNRPLSWPDTYVPKTIIKKYTIEAILPDGSSVVLADETNNYQRLRRHAAGIDAAAIRLTLNETWGAEDCHLFALDVCGG